MAEAMGMSVIYYDIIPLMSMGTARQVKTLNEVLDRADFVSLHVPELPETKGMIGKVELARMRDGAYLINNARGSIVDIPALIDALRTGKLAGAAIDVYPAEPAANGDYFSADALHRAGKPAIWAEGLRSAKNLILTPHIGGSTEEAQSAIGVEVSSALVKYVNEGITVGAVNMPEVTLRSLLADQVGHARVSFVLSTSNDEGVERQKLC